jgi:hypothetical protein
MRDFYTPSAKLQKQIESIPVKVGDEVYADIKEYNEYTRSTEHVLSVITKIKGNKLTIEPHAGSYHYSPITIAREKIIIPVHDIGPNPFGKDNDIVRTVAFTLESVLFNLGILEEKRIDNPIIFNGIKVQDLNWNPYIYNADGTKSYYQRDFVWSLEDNQLLVDSIYNSVDCGKILVRKHWFKTLEKLAVKGETELSFVDLIDGKQRLNAVKRFILGEYSDSYGNYFADLSATAKRKFTNHQLFSYSELPESTTDKQVLQQSLKLNFAGRPQSKEHLDFVKGILGGIK